MGLLMIFIIGSLVGTGVAIMYARFYEWYTIKRILKQIDRNAVRLAKDIEKHRKQFDDDFDKMREQRISRQADFEQRRKEFENRGNKR